MARQDRQPVRLPFELGRPGRRTLLQRLSMRRPGLFARVFTRVLRLPPGSRLRRVLLLRSLRQTYDAINRGDYEVAAAMLGEDYEMHIAQDGMGPGAGVADVYRGSEGARQAVEDFMAPFDSSRYEPHELIDIGDRVVVLLHMVARGRGSGVQTRQSLGIVYEIESGRRARERHYWEWKNALASVGLDNGV